MLTQQYIDCILNTLLDKYERSNISKMKSKRRMYVKIEMIFPHFLLSRGIENRFEQAQVLGRLEQEDIVMLIRNTDRDIIEVELNIMMVDRAYSRCGRTNIRLQQQAASEMFKDISTNSVLAKEFITHMLEKLGDFRSTDSFFSLTDFSMITDIIYILEALEQQDVEIAKRLFSQKIFGNSKRFEQLESKIIQILKLCQRNGEGESDTELLASFNVVKNPGFVYLKGDGMFQIGQQMLDLQSLQHEIGLSTASIHTLIFPPQNIERVMTIENLTSFFNIQQPNTLIIYLGGYHNQLRRELLQQIYQVMPDATYYHFGDIDVGGIQILRHLKKKTGIPFQPFLMDKKTLIKYRAYTQSLSHIECQKLENLKEDPDFTEVIIFMLKHNIKLEQEIVEWDGCI